MLDCQKRKQHTQEQPEQPAEERERPAPIVAELEQPMGGDDPPPSEPGQQVVAEVVLTEPLVITETPDSVIPVTAALEETDFGRASNGGHHQRRCGVSAVDKSGL